MGKLLSRPGVIWALAGLAGTAFVAYYFWTMQTYLDTLAHRLASKTEVGRMQISSPQEMERTVRLWIDELRYTSQRTDDRDSNFHFAVTMPFGAPLDVVNVKERPTLLVIQTKVIMGDVFAQLKAEMSDKEQRDFVLRLREKMLFHRINYLGLDFDLKEVILNDAFVFSLSLTAIDFSTRLFAVQGAAKLLSNAFELEMNRLGLPMTEFEPKRPN